MEQRKQLRFAVQLPVSFSGENFSGQGTIVDISAEGCGMISDTSPAVPSYITLNIHLNSDDSPVSVELAAVRWSSVPRCGVEFIRIAVEDQNRLRAFEKILEVER